MTINPIGSPHPIISLNGKKYSVRLLKGGKEVDLSNIKISDLQSNIKKMISADTTLQSKVTIHSKGLINNLVVKGDNLEKLQSSFIKINALAIETFSNPQVEKPKKLDGKRFTWLKIPMPNWAKRAFKSISKTFKNIWREVTNTYQRIFTPKKYQDQQQDTADSLYTKSVNRFETLQNESTTSIGDSTNTLQIDPSIKKRQEFNLKKKSLIKDYAVKGFNNNKLYEGIKPLISGGIEITATTVINDEVVTGQVVPSSFRSSHGKGITEEENHLLNCYTWKQDEKAVIRSGVIDTPEKAKEFITIAKSLRPGKKIRLVSHQLNTVGFEKKMIDNQHINLLKVVSDDEDVEIAHINTQANRLVEYEKLLPEKLQIGEAKSREQNLEGWAQSVQWLFEDLPIEQGENNAQAAILKNLVNDIQKCYAQDPIDTEVIKLHRLNLKTQLEDVYNKLKTLEDDHSETLGENLHTVKLMRALLGVQLRHGKEMSRGKEIMLMHLLNSKLGVISAMNCKTGADRTGFVHAIKMAQAQVIDGGMSEEDLFELVLNWDSKTKEINQYVREHSFDEFTQELNNREDWKHVNLFRKHVLENLIKHTLPITIISSGVTGFKWSRGVAQNRHPLNFIPSHVNFTGSDTNAQLIKIDRNGKPYALTEEGEALLLQFSTLRGA